MLVLDVGDVDDELVSLELDLWVQVLDSLRQELLIEAIKSDREVDHSDLNADVR